MKKRNVTIATSFPVSMQFLSDVLTNFVENCPSATSWLGDENSKVVRIEDDRDDKTWLEPLSVIRFTGRYDKKDQAEGERGGKTVIDLATISIGMSRALTYKDLRSDIRGAILTAIINDDAGEIDSEAADVIAQMAIFSEVVYS